MRYQSGWKRFTTVICATALMGISTFVQAQAGPSAGCQNVNDDSRDGQNGGGGTPDLEFFAGEIIQISAGEPATTTSIELRVGGVLVDSDSFPGSLSYEFPSDTTTFVQWDPGTPVNVTWIVNCEFGDLPPPEAAAQSIPTMPFYGLALTILGLLIVAGRRFSRASKQR